MSRWFRHYAGMARDDKLVRVALKAKQTPERVVWVWTAILESAAERDDASFEVDAGEMAYFLRCEEGEIQAIIDALGDAGRIVDGCVSKWDQRQFKADNSTERVKRHRANRAAAGLTSQWQPSPKLRHEIYARDGYACVYCSSDDDLTIDHKIPEMRGGSNEKPNLQTTCRRCNAKKRDLTHDEFVARNAVTVSETPQRTETETDILEPNGSCASGDANQLKPEHVVESWNDLAPTIGKPMVRDLTPERRVRLKARIAGYSIDDFNNVLAGISRSAFLRGDTGWHGCTFDWFTKKANFQKILEGNYDN